MNDPRTLPMRKGTTVYLVYLLLEHSLHITLNRSLRFIGSQYLFLLLSQHVRIVYQYFVINDCFNKVVLSNWGPEFNNFDMKQYVSVSSVCCVNCLSLSNWFFVNIVSNGIILLLCPNLQYMQHAGLYAKGDVAMLHGSSFFLNFTLLKFGVL